MPSAEIPCCRGNAGRARILLVDDDERNLLALAEVLDPLAEVVTATSGRMALRELLKDEFAVILLDVFMPDMDGYETAALIRQRSQTARIPIIFLSAVNKETEHLMRGYTMGAVDYVFKPVEPVVLRSKVAVFVDLFLLREQVAGQAMAEQELREGKLRAETERLAFERELQQTRLRQAAILEALPLALYEAGFNEHGRLVRRFVGGDLAEIAGGDTDALLAGELRWCDRIVGTADELEQRAGQFGRSDGHLALPLVAQRRRDHPRARPVREVGRDPGRLGRHAYRRDRAARARAAARPGAQGGSARPADRRRRARLQQPARRGARRHPPAQDASRRSPTARSRSSITCATRRKTAPSWSAA